MSNSSLRGFDFRFPFFLNISPSADITLVPRICTRRAAQTSVEFRYVPVEDTRGRFYGEYTYDWEYSAGKEPFPHRFYVTWNHYQNLLGLADLKINGNWVSDRDYFDLWGGRMDRRQRRITVPGIQRRPLPPGGKLSLSGGSETFRESGYSRQLRNRSTRSHHNRSACSIRRSRTPHYMSART